MTEAARVVVGWREWVRLPDLCPTPVKAKIDTGARTSALHAWDVVRADDAEGPRVRFFLHPLQHDDNHVVAASAPLLDEREVRSSNGEVERRPIVAVMIGVGDDTWPVEVSLSRRDEMGFRMLLGREALRGRALVDPGRSFLHGGNRRHPPATERPLGH